MLEKCKNLRHWLFSLQLGLCVLLFCSAASAQLKPEPSRNPAGRDPANRDPANYVIDDDVIVVPVEYDERMINTMFDFKYSRLTRIKEKVDFWAQREIWLENWGLENEPIFWRPSQSQKDDLYKRELVRYFTQLAGDPLREDLRSWWDSYREESIEEQNEVIQERQDDVVADLIDRELERRGLVKKGDVKGFEYKIKFRPRPFRKELDTILETNFADFRVRYGNGNDIEYLLDKRYRKAGLYWLVEYRAESKDYELVLDQRIYGPLSLRLTQIYTHTQSEEDIEDEIDPIERRAHLRYSVSF